ncbi:MAG: sulfite exporter TauE/SafE family protein [Chlorobi bacterium]|nr:sulfite exporter TauE/SafE family protein [Chlorobiota bacterium]
MDAIEVLTLIGGGLIGGITAGLLGLGGGPFYIYSLMTVMDDVPQHRLSVVLTAHSLAIIFLTSLWTIFNRFRNKTISWGLLRILLIPSFVASLLVRTAMHIFGLSPGIFLTVFSVIVVVGSIAVLFKKETNNSQFISEDDLKKGMLTWMAFVSGALAALAGVGGGLIIIPLLVWFMKMPFKQTAIISIGVTLGVAIASVLVIGVECIISGCGEFMPLSIALILLGVFPGVWLGILLHKILPVKFVKMAYFTIIVLLIIRMAQRMGVLELIT